MQAVVVRHFNGLMSMFAKQQVAPWFVLAIESNLGMEASHIEHMLRDYPRIVVLRETGSQGKCGVATTHQRKIEFVAVLERLLLDDAVCIAGRVVSDDAGACLANLKKQLLNYKQVNSEAGRSSAFALAKITYSGKVNEEGRVMPHAFQDDLCITLQLAAFWSSYVIQRRCKFLDYGRYYDNVLL